MDQLDPVDVEIGARLRERREAAGLTQTELGDHMGVTFQQVQKYEGGRSRIAVSALARAAGALGVRASALIGGILAETAETTSELSVDERELIVAYRQANPSLQRALVTIAKATAAP